MDSTENIPNDEKILKICLFVLTESTNVSVRHYINTLTFTFTDRQTWDGSIACTYA